MFGVGELSAQRRRVLRAIVDVRIDKVGDHLDSAAGASKCLDGLRLQKTRNGREAIGLLDGELGDRVKRRILANDGDIGAVEGGEDANIRTRVGKHLARDPCARRVRYRVVHVKQVELVGEDHLVHAHGERQVVRRILEERVAADVHLVKVDAREKRGQAKGLLVGDEVHLVSSAGERDAELRRNGSGAAVRRVAGDANLHGVVTPALTIDDSHRSATSIALGASGSTVVAPAGSW